MTISRETAKIFEFPSGGRAGSAGRLAGRLAGHFSQSRLEREAASLPYSVYDESWYHDAAITADDHAGKH